jgi:hypothetical protein
MSITNLKKGRVYFESASGAHTAIELGPGQGNMQISGLRENQTEKLPVMDRGEFLELVEGNQVFPTFTITVFHNGKITNSVDRTVLDSMLKTGAVASDSTTDVGGQCWAGKVYWIGSRAGAASRIDLGNCDFSVDYGEALEGNTISISGTCYARPTFS